MYMVVNVAGVAGPGVGVFCMDVVVNVGDAVGLGVGVTWVGGATV